MIPKCIKQKQLEDKVDKLSTYSTAERVIGKWIDGKPIYRKVIIYKPTEMIGKRGEVIDIWIAHNISNFKQLRSIEIVTSDGYVFPSMGSENGTNLDYGTRVLPASKTQVGLRFINDEWNPRTWYITLEYTKTTD